MAGCNGYAETQSLDSVVASIGNVAITATDVRKEYRFERFLEAQWPPAPPDANALNAARQRLTYQKLLTAEESPGTAEMAASEQAAASTLTALHKTYAHPEDYQRALQDLGMTEAEVLARIAQEELVLRLIDQRLRPAASPSDEDVAGYYRSTFAPEFQKANGGTEIPPLPAVESQIREVLVQKRINELLDQWIEELTPTAGLRFHSF
jgi:hypothetical protein